VVEFRYLDWGWVDSAEGKVFTLEGGRFGLDIGADIACFWPEEDIQNEFDGIGLMLSQYLGQNGQCKEKQKGRTRKIGRKEEKTHDCQNPVNPPISNPLSNESKNKRPNRNTQRNHHGPNTHIPRTLMTEESLSNHTTPNSHSGRDEKRD
jgi:hypothetical protein